MYEYTKVGTTDKQYLEDIDTIEKLKSSINITTEKLEPFFKEDRFNSVKIEGNSLEYNELQKMLDTGFAVRGKKLTDHLQARNLNESFTLLKMAVDNKYELNEDLIKWIHSILTTGELPLFECGQYRQCAEHISTTSYLPPLDTFIPEHMDELCKMYNRPLEFDTQFERICEFKRNFERIHPFADGNGRTGRFIMNLLLIQNGYAPITIEDNERQDYFDSIENNTFNEFALKKELVAMQMLQEKENTYDYEL